MSDHVPQEIVSEILSRLPVKSVLRFRCVSQQWLSLLEDPVFINSHLNHSLKTNSNRNLILTSRNNMYSVELESLDYATDLNHTVESEIFILGSCNGILCLYYNADKLVLWNPYTRNLHYLPDNGLCVTKSGTTSYQPRLFRFGYDHVKDDYKIFMILHIFGPNTDFSESQIRTYSLKLNSWGKIKYAPYYFLPNIGSDTIVNGSLHMVVKPNRPNPVLNKVHLIVALDLGLEEFRFVPQPDYLDEGVEFNLGVLGGCVSVFRNFPSGKTEVWVMKSYGVKESWTLLVSISQPINILSFKALRALAYSKSNEKLLLQKDNDLLVWCDLKNKTIENVEVRDLPKYFTAHICLESLVQISVGGSTGRKQRPLGEGEEKKPFA